MPPLIILTPLLKTPSPPSSMALFNFIKILIAYFFLSSAIVNKTPLSPLIANFSANALRSREVRDLLARPTDLRSTDQDSANFGPIDLNKLNLHLKTLAIPQKHPTNAILQTSVSTLERFGYHNLSTFCPPTMNPRNFTEIAPCMCKLHAEVPWLVIALRGQFAFEEVCSDYHLCPAMTEAVWNDASDRVLCQPCPKYAFKLFAGNHRCINYTDYNLTMKTIISPGFWHEVGETMRTGRTLPPLPVPATHSHFLPPFFNETNIWLGHLQNIFPLMEVDTDTILFKNPNRTYPWPLNNNFFKVQDNPVAMSLIAPQMIKNGFKRVYRDLYIMTNTLKAEPSEKARMRRNGAWLESIGAL